MALWQPIPVPTPYQSPSMGGNIYIKPGTTGQSVPASSYPSSFSNGYATFNTGQTYPQSSLYNYTPVSYPAVQGANTSNVSNPPTNQVVSPTGGGSPSVETFNGTALSDLNPGQRTQYAQGKGFAGWDEYQNYLNSQGGGGGGGDYAAQMEEAARPIFASLDEQLAGLAGSAANKEQQVANLYGSSEAEAKAGKERELGALGLAEKGEMTNSANSLRDLSENVRNVLSAASNIWGNSSAVQAATGGIAKFAGKQRGNVMEQRNTALSQINQKKADVESVFNTTINKLQTWANNEKLNIAQWLKDTEMSIKQQRAELQGNLRMEAINQANQYLQQLKNQATQYQQGIDTWKMQRQADLQDYEQKLKLASQYQGQGYGYTIPGTSAGATTQVNPADYAKSFDYGYSANGRGYKRDPITGQWVLA